MVPLDAHARLLPDPAHSRKGNPLRIREARAVGDKPRRNVLERALVGSGHSGRPRSRAPPSERHVMQEVIDYPRQRESREQRLMRGVCFMGPFVLFRGIRPIISDHKSLGTRYPTKVHVGLTRICFSAPLSGLLSIRRRALL